MPAPGRNGHRLQLHVAPRVAKAFKTGTKPRRNWYGTSIPNTTHCIFHVHALYRVTKVYYHSYMLEGCLAVSPGLIYNSKCCDILKRQHVKSPCCLNRAVGRAWKLHCLAVKSLACDEGNNDVHQEVPGIDTATGAGTVMTLNCTAGSIKSLPDRTIACNP